MRIFNQMVWLYVMAAVMNIDTSGICALQEVYNKLVSHNIHVRHKFFSM